MSLAKWIGYFLSAISTGILVGLSWAPQAPEGKVSLDSSRTPESAVEPDAARYPLTTCGHPGPAVQTSNNLGTVQPTLIGFRGDTLWIHHLEGHVGRPYWPGGASGITLDPGIDLGHVEPQLVESAFARRLPRHQYQEISGVLGIQGVSAQALLRDNTPLNNIRISRATAAEVFPLLLRPYWNGLRQRFRTLEEPQVPAEVHTALLSLAYNRGTWNPDLTHLHQPLERYRWNNVAQTILSMQQDHLLEGIRLRRRSEGRLISQGLVQWPGPIHCQHNP